MKRKTSKWLLRKISGSRNKHSYKPDYADTRNTRKGNIENLPQRESMGKGHSWLDTTLVKRWLYSQKGRDFDEVYSVFLTRIQPKYLEEYRECIYYYVDKAVEVRFTENSGKLIPGRKAFYIDPKTNKLEMYSQIERKNCYVKPILNPLGAFYWNEEQQIWETRMDTPRFVVQGDIEGFSKEEIDGFKSILDQTERITAKAAKGINEFALAHQIRNVSHCNKYLLCIEFLSAEKSRKYNLYFEVGTPKETWKVEFEEFVVRNVSIKINLWI